MVKYKNVFNVIQHAYINVFNAIEYNFLMLNAQMFLMGLYTKMILMGLC